MNEENNRREEQEQSQEEYNEEQDQLIEKYNNQEEMSGDVESPDANSEKTNIEQSQEQKPKQQDDRNSTMQSDGQQIEQLEQEYEKIVNEKQQDNHLQNKPIHYQSPKTKQSNNQSKRTFGGFFKLLAAGIIGSVLTLGIATQTDMLDSEQDAVIQPETATETTAEPVSTSGSVADITENASEAIVGIVNMSEAPQNPFQQFEQPDAEVKRGVGSGVIYKVVDDGAYIVTNNHVIEGASSLKVALSNGNKVDGEVVGTDPLTDIAVVKIKGDYDITPLKFGDSDTLRSGDEVIAIGNPLGLDLSRTVTKGIVSAKDRTISVNTSAGKWDFDVIQTDAAINPGNSGGALINMNGELVGINSLKIENNGAEGLGFAIPSNKVQELIDELSENGKIERPYMGVGLKSVSEIPRYYLQGLPEDVKDGAVVLSVDEHSAAKEAGLQIEDVIVSIDGNNVANDNDVRSYLYKERKAGDEISLKIYRDGESKTVKLTLTSNADAK